MSIQIISSTIKTKNPINHNDQRYLRSIQIFNIPSPHPQKHGHFPPEYLVEFRVLN